MTEALRDEVATQITEELLELANDGDQLASLKLGQTYTQLFVAPDFKSAYVWLSIAQAYGLEGVAELLENTTKQLTMEEILQQQDAAAATFEKINNEISFIGVMSETKLSRLSLSPHNLSSSETASPKLSIIGFNLPGSITAADFATTLRSESAASNLS